MKRITFFLLLGLLLPAAAAAQERSAEATVRQLLRPEVMEQIRRSPRLGAGVPATEQPFGGALALERAAPGEEPRVGTILRLADPGALDELRAIGAEIGAVVGDIATAWVPLASLERAMTAGGVAHVEVARALELVHDTSMIAIQVDVLRQQIGGTWSGATGRGVIVGIYDTGIDLQHPDFIDVDGRTRVISLWDQVNTISNPPPGFTRGFYCAQQAIQTRLDTGNPASCPQNDSHGHGTHVAGTAAGNGSAGVAPWQYRFTGVAPEADLVIVRGGPGIFFENLVIEGLAFIKAQAVARGQPAVVNLSLGGQFGPHDGSRLYEQVIDQLSSEGFVVVVSAGNNGSNVNVTPNARERLIHARGVPSGLQPVEFELELCLNSPAPGCAPYTPSTATCQGHSVEMNFWYEAQDQLRIEVLRPSGSSVAASRGQLGEGDDAGGRIVIDNGRAGPGPENGAVEAIITIDGCASSGPPEAGTWRILVTPEVAGSGLPFDFWVYRSVVGVDGISRGTRGFDNRFVIASPGNATRAITVAAFATRMCWPTQTSGQICYTQREQIGDLARFSGAGPRRDHVHKPEIAAPGIGVASARSRDILISATRVLPSGQHFILEGTSMAAPHVTGGIAILFQANPLLTPEAVRSVLQATASSDAFTARTYGTTGSGASPMDWWGYGKLNVRDALLSLGGTAPAVLAISSNIAVPDSAVLGRRGNHLPLLEITLESRGDESISVLGLTFEVRGQDTGARLLLVRDLNGNGLPDPGEPVLASVAAPLAGASNRIQVRPDSLRVPAGGETRVLVALELSGSAPHGALFQADLIAAATLALGSRSLSQNPLDIGAIVGSGPARTSLLRSDQVVTMSENPVRGNTLFFHFAETPSAAAVYTLSGRQVIDLIPALAGGDRVEWDLTNAQGNRIVPGVYLIVLRVGARTFRERVIILGSAAMSGTQE